MLHTVDWIIILLYFLLNAGIIAYYSRRAGQSLNEYFLSGRSLPWYVAGTTMVATTFAADTPLAVTELVARNGIAGNWLWWNMLIGGMFTAFFFAKLWRRANIMTDVEFVEIRYDGKPAAFLRGFRAIYLGLFMNIVIMGWVNLAMVKVLRVMFPDFTFFGIHELSVAGFTFSSHLLLVGSLLFLVAVYSSLAGLWGVAITDMVQFTLAMVGTVALAIVVLGIPEIGGLKGLKAALPEDVFRFTPVVGNLSTTVSGVLTLSVSSFIAFIGVQWWASWYPGAEPGGGGYVAQRMMSAKNENHSVGATLWFMIAHYALRPWPWIIVALASMVLYPQLADADKGAGYVMVMRDYLPTGLLGLLMAAFLAAFMSTISTQLNWGTSYIVNDFYKRFFHRGKDERQLVFISRITTLVLMIISLVLTTKMDRISDAWTFILECSAGIGLVLILRWFWWRVNAWSEITAMVAPLILYPFLPGDVQFPDTLFIIVCWSTFWWVAVTCFTKPTDSATLESFYQRVSPGGWWGAIGGHRESNHSIRWLAICWLSATISVYAVLFAIGHFLFHSAETGFLLLIVGLVTGLGVKYALGKANPVIN
ncbi:MAG: sodium:solute symporter family protein [Fidelibacterota bacterium]